MKKKEIRGMTDEMLRTKLNELKRELNIERGSSLAAAGRSSNPGKIRNLRRTIARIETALSLRAKGVMK
jgi:large subunit ribosomal protein L29